MVVQPGNQNLTVAPAFHDATDPLDASWQRMCRIAEEYYRKYGSLEPPEHPPTEEEAKLRAWLCMQRSIRAGDAEGSLTDEQIETLDSIGMRWDSRRDTAWERYYAAAQKYYREHHSLEMHPQYETENGVLLGTWLSQLRISRKTGRYSSYLTPDHIAQLDQIGMVWDVYDFVFERNFHAAVEYYRENGDLECASGYVDAQGIKLAAWLNDLRRQYKKCGRSLLTEEQFRMLDSIGMRWGSKFDLQWDHCYGILAAYIERTHLTTVPVTWKEGTFALGVWLRRQQELFVNGKLRKDRADKLTMLGVVLSAEALWETQYQLVKTYSEAHGGSLKIPPELTIDGLKLHKWVTEQQLIGEGKRKKVLTPEQRQKLEAIGMMFGKCSADKTWDEHYQELHSYVARSGSTDIPPDLLSSSGVKLFLWLKRQYTYARKGQLSEEKAEKLRKLGFVLEKSDPFVIGLAYARKYFETHGDLLVRNGFECEDGFDLVAWIVNARQNRRKNKLSAEQVQQLDAIGMVWNTQEHQWNEMFEAARAFAVPGSVLCIPLHQRTKNGKDLYDWYIRQRKLYVRGKLSADRAQKLLSIGAELKPRIRRDLTVMNQGNI